jgi:peptidoglycan/LPS O-acetylase OafA/YrhL
MKKEENEVSEERKVKISQNFVVALALVSIISFVGIISESLFEYNLNSYVESLFMFVIGIGLILESKIKKIKSLKYGLNPKNFANLITAIIGVIAIFAGIFSFPQIKITTPAFVAVKGIISIIAIIVIVIQTWFLDYYPK